MFWQTSRFRIDLETPQVMGIVNVTPDSFSDGGQHQTTKRALLHCEALVEAGATILDIGGESTRPGAQEVSAQDELARVLPVVRELVTWNVPLSVDTYKSAVMQSVLDEGADIINDIWALRQSGSQRVIASHKQCGVCLMHMHGEPRTMQTMPMTGAVTESVKLFLEQVSQELIDLGVQRERIAIDPGIGFGKTVNQNFELLTKQAEFEDLNLPLLIGWSRKSSLGAITGCDVDKRLIPSVAAAVLALERGAKIIRVHDVAETAQALKVWMAARSST